MSEEQKAPTGATTEGSTAADAQPAVVSQSSAAATTPDLATLLDTIDPETLTKHPRVAGILGSRIDQAIRRRQAETDAEARAKAEAEQDEDLSRLLDENDETLSERYPKARERLQALRAQRSEEATARRIGESVNEFATRIGQHYARLPEWSEIVGDPARLARLEQAVKAQTDQVAAVGAFAEVATDLVAEARAEKKAKARVDQEVEAARKAERQAVQAEALSNTPASGTKKPTGVPSKLAQIRAMTPQQIEEYWKKTYG